MIQISRQIQESEKMGKFLAGKVISAPRDLLQPHDLCTGQSPHAVLCLFGPAAFERSGLHTKVSLWDTNLECEGSLQLELWWQEQQNVLW